MTKILTAGITELDEDKFQPVLPYDQYNFKTSLQYEMNKPNGCLWGSTLITGNPPYLSDWLGFSITEFEPEIAMKYNKGIIFNLKDNARILTISSREDYITLPDKYFIGDTVGHISLYHTLYKMVLDWEVISKDYDAFHLTDSAIYDMRLPLDQLRDKNGYWLSDFYTWDVESWVMFNLDCIDKNSIQKYDNLYLLKK